MKHKRDVTGVAGLPLIRLSLVEPFFAELDRRGVDADTVLREHELSRGMLVSPELFVPATVVYGLAEDPAVFTRSFRKWTGRSPREFRTDS